MPPKPLQIRSSTAEFLIFTKQAGENGVEVRVQDGTIWLSQKLMATLFDCSTDNISLHLKNIFADGELIEIPVAEDFSATAADGKNYRTKHYNLGTIIAVGHRFPAMGYNGSQRLCIAGLRYRLQANGKLWRFMATSLFPLF